MIIITEEMMRQSQTGRPINSKAMAESVDEMHMYRARDAACRLQSNFLHWQNGRKKMKGKDAVSTSQDYAKWYEKECAEHCHSLDKEQSKQFKKLAEMLHNTYSSWAKAYEDEQKQAYAEETQHAVLLCNKAMLTENIHEDMFARQCLEQIMAASRELARLQKLPECECCQLEESHVVDALKCALQAKIELHEWELAATIFDKHGMLLDAANYADIQHKILSCQINAKNEEAKSIHHSLCEKQQVLP